MPLVFFIFILFFIYNFFIVKYAVKTHTTNTHHPQFTTSQYSHQLSRKPPCYEGD
uniref:Uncharacterized protein n=1 Tax=Anguilla anguilla TaxID=7936 RepID=A0A0E9Q511_ANGAN